MRAGGCKIARRNALVRLRQLYAIVGDLPYRTLGQHARYAASQFDAHACALCRKKQCIHDRRRLVGLGVQTAFRFLSQHQAAAFQKRQRSFGGAGAKCLLDKAFVAIQARMRMNIRNVAAPIARTLDGAPVFVIALQHNDATSCARRRNSGSKARSPAADNAYINSFRFHGIDDTAYAHEQRASARPFPKGTCLACNAKARHSQGAAGFESKRRNA